MPDKGESNRDEAKIFVLSATPFTLIKEYKQMLKYPSVICDSAWLVTNHQCLPFSVCFPKDCDGQLRSESFYHLHHEFLIIKERLQPACFVSRRLSLFQNEVLYRLSIPFGSNPHVRCRRSRQDAGSATEVFTLALQLLISSQRNGRLPWLRLRFCPTQWNQSGMNVLVSKW